MCVLFLLHATGEGLIMGSVVVVVVVSFGCLIMK